VGLSVAIVLVGIGLAYTMYVKERERPAQLAERFAGLYRVLFNKWYVDELYALIAVRPLHRASLFLWKGIDVLIIDGVVNGLARVVGWSGTWLRTVQTGYVQAYAVSFLLGVVGLMLYTLFVLVP